MTLISPLMPVPQSTGQYAEKNLEFTEIRRRRGGLGKHCALPSRVRGSAPAANAFSPLSGCHRQ